MTLCEKMKKAQERLSDPLIELIEQFSPLLIKYARMLDRCDSKNELTLFFIELIYKLNLQEVNNTSDGALINYISRSIYHEYIRLSSLHSAKQKNEIAYDSENESHELPDNHSGNRQNEFILDDFLREFLTETEYIAVHMVFFEGYDSVTAAAELGVSKQAFNQAKNRALDKLRIYYLKDSSSENTPMRKNSDRVKRIRSKMGNDAKKEVSGWTK